jgi:hypothetical protein
MDRYTIRDANKHAEMITMRSSYPFWIYADPRLFVVSAFVSLSLVEVEH